MPRFLETVKVADRARSCLLVLEFKVLKLVLIPTLINSGHEDLSYQHPWV